MSTLSIVILAALLLFIGLTCGFIAGLDYRDHQARTERRAAEFASREILTNRTTGERRLHIVRNGRPL